MSKTKLKGYTGKYLDIDLTTQEATIKELPADWPKKYIGGIGFGIKVAWDNIPQDVDALSSRNVISFWTGPFTGTMVPVSSRYAAVAKSPLTGTIGFDISSGYFGTELKRAGWDGVVIRGKARKPVYIFIEDNDIVEFRDAKQYLGKSTWEVEDLIKEELDDPSIRTLTIGRAGEGLVRYASITNDKNQSVGRSGMGAVMGSKNLKAIAIRGTNNIEVADLNALTKQAKQLYKECRDPAMRADQISNPVNMLKYNKEGILTTNNHQQMTFEHVKKVSSEKVIEKKVKKIIACEMCPVACNHISIIEEGEYKGAVGNIDFESVWALGPFLGIDTLDAITKAIEYCDTLGIDTISTGGVIAWAMECYEKGIFTKEDTDGLELNFGNHQAMVELVRRIGNREGKFASLLGEGSKRAALQTGKDTIKFAMQIKGLETSVYPFRVMQTRALGYATGILGFDHGFIEDNEVDRFSLDDKRGKFVADNEDDNSVIDSLIICNFGRQVYPKKEKLAEIWKWVTGEDITYEQLQSRGKTINTLGKCFNVRHGFTRKDDYLPARSYENALDNDKNKKVVVKMEQWDKALDSYYEERGWDTKTSIPKKETLKQLGLEEAAEEVGV